MRLLDVWYSRVDASAIVAMSRRRRRAVHRGDPPLLTHVEECHPGWVEEILARYRASLSDERRQLLGRFQAQDAARKVVGVGSVGTRCYVVLLGGGDRRDDPLLLQVEQATASVLEPCGGRSRYRHPLDTLDPADLVPYGRLCGWVLARAHARSGDRFDRAVADFAEAYADQTEADHAAFTRALGSTQGDAGRGGVTNQRKGDGG
jgi:hypothetical protein